MHIVESLLRVALLGSEWVMYLLIFLSVLSFSAMFERWLFFRKYGRTGSSLRGRLAAALQQGDLDEAQRILAGDRSVIAKVVSEALRFRAGGPQAVADAADSEIGRVRPELERGLNMLGTLGNNAPFVGLFGTVIGVIQAFHQLGGQGNKAAAMGHVMNGIAEALVATGIGIFVALPAVVAYNAAQKKIGQIEGEAQSLVKLVTAQVMANDGAATARSAHGDASARVLATERAGKESTDARSSNAAVPQPMAAGAGGE
jgi:biopolymer transport protein ExbB/biopolymer transport protein TolQ